MKPGNDPQEVARDKSTQQYVFQYKAYQTLWHKTLQKLPPSQIIDIPYLKQLEICKIVPIAYCEKGDIDTVTNFVSGYLARVTRRLWELYDEEDYVVDTYSWDEGGNTILDAFGTSIQHPEENFVQYFGGTPVSVIEQGSPCLSPRKKPTETDNEEGRKGLSSLGSFQHIDSTLEGTTSLATGNIIYDPSNVQKSNIQTHPRKAIPCQLPLKKHRHFNLLPLSIYGVSKTQLS